MGEVIREIGNLVYLDTNIVVYAIEGFPQYASTIRAVLSAMDEGKIKAATSELTLAEVLVRPKQLNDEALERAYLNFLQPSPALQVIPIDRRVLIEAAATRSSTRLPLPDAIHIATARLIGTDTLLTNDHAMQAVPHIRVQLLADLAG